MPSLRSRPVHRTPPATSCSLPATRYSLLLAILPLLLSAHAAEFNIRDYGAVGDGKTVDSPAINRAIEAAAAAGGGTVRFPAGTYLSFSLRLKSHLSLVLDAGCTLLAASPATHGGVYDPPEPNPWGDLQYQDFGHSHWHDALLWGEGLEDLSITGAGRIFGQGLARAGGGRGGRTPQGPNGTFGPGDPPPAAPSTSTASSAPPVASATTAATTTPPTPPNAAPSTSQNSAIGIRQSAIPGAGGRGPGFGGPGSGNKAISLKNCRNVTLRDFSLLQCGWFAVLVTGVDNLTLDNLRVDTNRDGFDIDSCRNVRLSHCTVNSINDDGIVLKSTYALGELRPCENITISDCAVSGYDVGSVLDGTYQRTQERATDRDGPTGRIKLGTESNGGFKNIAITNCVFARSRGLALETVDGAVIEDVTVSNLSMRDLSSSPIFLRLGNRARGPAGTPVGVIRRVSISHVVASHCDPRYPLLLAGLAGHPIEDIRLSDIRVDFRGGLTLEQVAQQPADLVNPFFLRGPGLTGPRDPYAPPEQEKGYPEPSMFGLLPAYGLFIRHARDLTIDRLDVRYEQEDTRPAITLVDVTGITFTNTRAQHAAATPTFVLRQVRDFSSRGTPGLPDTERAVAENESL